MNDPLSWSVPLGRWFGITVRMSLLFPLVSLGLLLRVVHENPAYAGVAALLQLMLFVSVLMHEFGHCFTARAVDGDADDILMWPLGGLASVQLPNVPRAHLLTALGGPAVNLLLCAATFGGLTMFGFLPPINPFWNVYVDSLYSWHTGEWVADLGAVRYLAQFFFVNWLLMLFNMVVVGFPLDGARVLQAILWTRLGFVGSMRIACWGGYVVAGLLMVLAMVTVKGQAEGSFMLFAIAVFIGLSSWQQLQLLEAGALAEEGFMGYDFSQGYTSLERRAPARQSWWQKWKQDRAAKRRLREEEQEAAEQARVDQLLIKVQEQGLQSLTGEERRFLNRVSAKLRHKKES